MFVFFTAVNHLSGLLRKQVYFNAFEMSLFVIAGVWSVIIIETHNYEGSFWTSEFACFWKAQKGLDCLLHQFLYIFQFTCLKLIVNSCIKHKTCYVNHLLILRGMIYILSWTTKKHFKKTLSRPLLSKLKQIQGLFKTVQYERVFKTSTKTATWLFF